MQTPTQTPEKKKTISYSWTEEKYDLISKLAKRDNRKMRNMLEVIVDFYIDKNNLWETLNKQK